jgi:hypothetical protein
LRYNNFNEEMVIIVKNTANTKLDKIDEKFVEPERWDYDNLFKTLLYRYFWEALKILLPVLYEAADRSEAPEFLDKEMQKVTFDLGEGANRADLLVRIKLKTRVSELILVHLEIQGEGGGELSVRMYRYKQMIYLRYGEEPVGIAVLTAPRPRGEKTSYSWERFGVKVAYEYLNVVVIELDDAVLLAEDSRIGLVLYAAKCVWQSGDDERKKFQYLRKVTSLWAERGWGRDDKRLILLAIDYLMNLKNEGDVKQYVEHMKTLNMSEEDREMYVSMFERVYNADGHKEGRAEVANNMLNDGISVEKIVQYTNLPREEIETLLSN